MLSKRWVAPFVLIATMGYYGCAAAQEAPSRNSEQAMLEAKAWLGRDELIAIYKTEIDRLGLQALLQDKTPRLREELLDWGFSKMAVIEEPVTMFVDVKTREILALTIEARRKKYPWRDDRGYKTSLSMEDAEKVANEHLGLISVHVKRYLPAPPDRIRVRSLRYHPDDNTWTAVFEKTYHGYPVDGFLGIDFWGDGEFLGFSSGLEIVDCPTEVVVSKDEAKITARAAAREILWLYGRRGKIGRDCVRAPCGGPWPDNKEGDLRIIATNPIMKGPAVYRLFEEIPSPSNYRLAYEFGFEIDTTEGPECGVCVFIDAQTGKCVGGILLGW